MGITKGGTRTPAEMTATEREQNERGEKNARPRLTRERNNHHVQCQALTGMM
uniref:Uncharacterized protein n=1 Tax=Anguilla anguilla TaxID=7936 RepID=A0A0E9QPA0_ANGAN